MANEAVLDNQLDETQQAIMDRLKKKQAAKRAARRVGEKGSLTITSLMDMMTIILTFLLKNYGSEPIKMIPGVDPPFSIFEIKPRDTTVITITTGAIVLMETQVLQLVDRKVEKTLKKGGESGMIIQPLEMALRDEVEKQKNFARQTGAEFAGELIILSDHETPYRLIAEVMQTAIVTEFKKFQFACLKDFRLGSSGLGKIGE